MFYDDHIDRTDGKYAKKKKPFLTQEFLYVTSAS